MKQVSPASSALLLGIRTNVPGVILPYFEKEPINSLTSSRLSPKTWGAVVTGAATAGPVSVALTHEVTSRAALSRSFAIPPQQFVLVVGGVCFTRLRSSPLVLFRPAAATYILYPPCDVRPTDRRVFALALSPDPLGLRSYCGDKSLSYIVCPQNGIDCSPCRQKQGEDVVPPSRKRFKHA